MLSSRDVIGRGGPTALAVIALLLSSSCSSSAPAAAASSTTLTTSTPTTRPATTPPAPTQQRPSPRSALGRRIDTAIAHVTTAHVDATYTEYGSTDVEHNDVQLTDGQVTALHSTGPYTGGTLEIVVVGGKIYVKAPGHARTPSRPWVLAGPSDPDTTVANLAQAPKGSLLDDSPAEYVQLAEDAVAVSRPTPARLDGLAATRYQVLVDGSKTSPDLLGSLPNSQVEPLPVDVYLDGQGRLVRVTTSTTVGGKPASLVLRFSRFNSPIRIAAPSGQVVGPS